MLIEKLNMERIPESHNKSKKSGTTFGYTLLFLGFCASVPLCLCVKINGVLGWVLNKQNFSCFLCGPSVFV
jgi:hypothetical protein